MKICEWCMVFQSLFFPFSIFLIDYQDLAKNNSADAGSKTANRSQQCLLWISGWVPPTSNLIKKMCPAMPSAGYFNINSFSLKHSPWAKLQMPAGWYKEVVKRLILSLRNVMNVLHITSHCCPRWWYHHAKKDKRSNPPPHLQALLEKCLLFPSIVYPIWDLAVCRILRILLLCS